MFKDENSEWYIDMLSFYLSLNFTRRFITFAEPRLKAEIGGVMSDELLSVHPGECQGVFLERSFTSPAMKKKSAILAY